MVNRELNRQLQRLRRLFGETAAVSSGNLELQAHWAQHLCVLVAGFLENAIEEIFGDFVKAAASEPVARFAMSALSRVQNPKANRFVEVAKSFKDSWGENLEVFLDQSGRRDAIDSIMANRHQIAHGGYSGITVARVRDYLDKSIEVIDFIENQCSGG
jgi:hypothetical protein